MNISNCIISAIALALLISGCRPERFPSPNLATPTPQISKITPHEVYTQIEPSLQLTNTELARRIDILNGKRVHWYFYVTYQLARGGTLGKVIAEMDADMKPVIDSNGNVKGYGAQLTGIPGGIAGGFRKGDVLEVIATLRFESVGFSGRDYTLYLEHADLVWQNPEPVGTRITP